jgi:hypothetical protein
VAAPSFDSEHSENLRRGEFEAPFSLNKKKKKERKTNQKLL